ncbi:MAG: UpxY family transcription antiterminator [Oscillospiraceae bacterium]|nr:UpxY family transcription antiterminator [Oscillospiraceae bacterium]
MDENNIQELVPAVDVTDDREARSKYWIAAYTRSKSELKAARELARLDINVYVPTQSLIRQWSDRKKKIIAPVIPMVIFAKIRTDAEILIIKKHPLILKILCLPGDKSPAYIPARQIEQLKFIIDRSVIPLNFVTGSFKSSDKVRITRGPFLGIEGIVEKNQDGKTKIIVVIDFLGGAKIDIKETDIELIKQVKTKKI